MQLTANFSLAELTVAGRNMPNVPNEAEVASLRSLAENILHPPEQSPCTAGPPARSFCPCRIREPQAAQPG